jgi:hypothetical protein
MSELQASEQVSMSQVMERFRGSRTAPGARLPRAATGKLVKHQLLDRIEQG